jgi:hypothetical protein
MLACNRGEGPGEAPSQLQDKRDKQDEHSITARLRASQKQQYLAVRGRPAGLGVLVKTWLACAALLSKAARRV